MLWQFDFLVKGKTNEQPLVRPARPDEEQWAFTLDKSAPGNSAEADKYVHTTRHYDRPVLRFEQIYHVIAKNENEANDFITKATKEIAGIETLAVDSLVARKKISDDHEYRQRYDSEGAFVITSGPLELTCSQTSMGFVGTSISAALLGMLVLVFALMTYFKSGLLTPTFIAVAVIGSGIWIVDRNRISLKLAIASHSVTLVGAIYVAASYIRSNSLFAEQLYSRQSNDNVIGFSLLAAIWCTLNLISLVYLLTQTRAESNTQTAKKQKAA